MMSFINQESSVPHILPKRINLPSFENLVQQESDKQDLSNIYNVKQELYNIIQESKSKPIVNNNKVKQESNVRQELYNIIQESKSKPIVNNNNKVIKEEKCKKNQIPEYLPQPQSLVQSLLFYCPANQYYKLKISLVILFILFILLIVGIFIGLLIYGFEQWVLFAAIIIIIIMILIILYILRMLRLMVCLFIIVILCFTWYLSKNIGSNLRWDLGWDLGWFLDLSLGCS